MYNAAESSTRTPMTTKDTRLPESLDEIVSHSATVLADQIKKAATWAKSEMDLQVEVAGALKDFARRAQVKLEGHHNVTVATGRPDSVYGSVIVEYKDPGTLSANRDAANNKKLIEQLKKRFYDFRREEKRQWGSMFGVGTDGKYFVFLRFRDDKWTDLEPLEVNRYSTERFLWALYNLGQKGKPYQPEYLHGDFGSDSAIAQEGVRALYNEILSTQNPRAQVFFNQWKILFGEVCGYDVENLSDKLKKLAAFYDVGAKPQPAALLFALHTYYAVLIKLLAAEIVSFFNPWMPRQVEKLLNASTSQKLRRELEQLERGGIFHEMGITNFLEGDLFSWYLAEWSDEVEKLTRRMIGKLDEYNPGTFSEDPAQSRDLLKKLYQQLFPKSVRHDLGEYYTPDWLAEHVLNELGYEGDPDKRLLDPACGSGTFLVMAINRIRRWYDSNRERCAYDEGDLLKRILANVIGFDLNPLAVMAARTNYLVAIKDLIRHVDRVEIPVYLCDSIMTPAEYGDLFTGGMGNVAKVPCSAMKPPHLLVPKEIAKNPREVAKYAEVLETCVKNAYTPKEFLARCQDEGLQITANDAHIALYKELVRLDKENKNGIWARIIKNNFAPLFVGQVDYVAGNPPWINWQSLPAEYREDSAKLWRTYSMVARAASKQFELGKQKRELSALFTYACVDKFLRFEGKLGFVITQTLFKTRTAESFRKFKYSNGQSSANLRVLAVDDMSELLPFEAATNRTAVFICQKSDQKTEYPVPYKLWQRKARKQINEAMGLEVVLSNIASIPLSAVPMNSEDDSSSWITTTKGSLAGLRTIMGPCEYKAIAGTCTWLNGVYWVEVKKRSSESLVVQNLSQVGKKKVEQVHASVEPALVYPLLRGRDVKRWDARPSVHIIYPHTRSTGWQAIPIDEMKKKFPRTLAYLKGFEKELLGRAGYSLLRAGHPFYILANTNPEILATTKVVFKELSTFFQAAVVSADDRAVVPDTKLRSIAVDSLDEAHYVCAVLNSTPAVLLLYVSAQWVQTPDYQATDIQRLKIPRFDSCNPLHKTLVRLSKQAHKLAASDGNDELPKIQLALDSEAGKLWGLKPTMVRQMADALDLLEPPHDEPPDD